MIERRITTNGKSYRIEFKYVGSLESCSKTWAPYERLYSKVEDAIREMECMDTKDRILSEPTWEPINIERAK